MADGGKFKVLGVSGSLRRGSLNTAVLKAAQRLAPQGMEIGIFDLRPIPLYDDDVRQQGFPAAVEAFREAIRAADALLFVTPEYNYSIPGVLKNAIDWASRPPEQPFLHKPIAIMGASPSPLGTARAQYHLRQCFVFLDGLVMNRPELMLSGAQHLFDEDGALKDEAAGKRIAEFLQGVATWVRKAGAAAAA